MTASESWAPITISDEEVPEVTVDWVYENLDSGAFRFIDVREDHEINGPLGSVEGHEHVPLGGFAEAAQDWDPDQAYVITCRSGRRSGRAAHILEDLGFERVASVAGGMVAWNEKGYPRKG